MTGGEGEGVMVGMTTDMKISLTHCSLKENLFNLKVSVCTVSHFNVPCKMHATAPTLDL